MSDKINRTDLEALGLVGCRFSEGTPVPDIDAATEEGLVEEFLVVSLAICIDRGFLVVDDEGGEHPVEFVDLDIPQAGEAGIVVGRADPNPAILRMYSQTGDALTVSWTGGAPDPALSRADASDPGTIYIELACKGAYSVMRPVGKGVLLLDGQDGPALFTVEAGVADAPYAEVPVAQWCAACDDSWLADAVHDRAATLGSLGDAVAAGMLWRLYEHGSADAAMRAVEDLLAGKPATHTSAPLTWIHDLEPDDLQAIEKLAVEEVDRVRAQLADVSGRGLPESQAWRRDLLEVLRLRDDLECVRQILAERVAAVEVDGALDALDAEGSSFMATAPDVEPFDDERLVRAWLRDDSAWWAFVPHKFLA